MNNITIKDDIVDIKIRFSFDSSSEFPWFEIWIETSNNLLVKFTKFGRWDLVKLMNEIKKVIE